MARIKLRPEDMALLAQRMDATSEELVRTARRLEADLEATAFNADDQEFSPSRLMERSAVVRSRLRQLADEMGVDAGLLATAANGGDHGFGQGWLRSLQALAAGWGPTAGLGSAWSGVASGLGQLVGAVAGSRPQSAELVTDVQGGSTVDTPPVMVDESMASRQGGLFVSVSASGDGDVSVLGGLLGKAARADDEAAPNPDWGGVWNRIQDDMASEAQD